MLKQNKISAPTPLYFRIYASLLERIKNGEFSESIPLPSERMLTEEYGVSRITVIKALDLLKNEGIVDRQHGKGTFIRGAKLANDPSASLTDNLTRLGITPEWRVIKRQWYSLPSTIAQTLDLKGEKSHFQTTVMLFADDLPIAYHMLQIPSKYARLEHVELMTDAELLQFYKDFPGRQKCIVERGFEAIPAGEKEAELLKVDVNTPILLIDLFYKNKKGEAIAFIRSFFRGDSFRYHISSE